MILQDVGISAEGLYTALQDKFAQYYPARSEKRIVLSHGDLTLSNILWDTRMGIMKLIDPRGSEHMYMDEYYDLAKLSQSINGRYEEILEGSYLPDAGKASLHFKNPPSKYREVLFNEYLLSLKVDIRVIRVYEAALFLSMTPMHIEDHQRIAAFLIQCSYILNNL
jgi:thiamine kinase-like enzyme